MEEENNYKCLCGKEFKSKKSLSGHQSACPTYLESIGKLQWYTCDVCGKKFIRPQQLQMHYRMHLSTEEIRAISSPRSKVMCPTCGRLIGSSVIKRHVASCKGVNGTIPRVPMHDGLTCQFCGKEYKNRNALVQHEIRCPDNTNRINCTVEGFNNFGRKSWNKGLTAETDERVARYVETCKNTWKTCKRLRDLNHFREGGAKRGKWGIYKGFYCDSGWELAFIIYCLDNEIKVKRNKESFPYVFEGEEHKFFPDFIIDDTFYEIKGRYLQCDYEKISQFPKDKKLIVIDRNNIKPYIDFCTKKYGDYASMYDRRYPSWMDVKNNSKKYLFKN